MKAAIAQISTHPGACAENCLLIKEQIQAAYRRGAQLLVFPELCIGGYAHLDLATRPAFVDANLAALESLLPAVPDMVVVVGFIDREPGRQGPNGREILFNSSAVLYQGACVAVRDKALLPAYDIFYEGRYFFPGRRSGVVEVANLKLGLGICEDLWDCGYGDKIYPRLLAEGAQLLINTSASPFHLGKLPVRQQRIAALGRQGQVPFIYANLVGVFDGYEGEVVFDGRSLIYNAQAELIAQAAAFAPELMLVDLDTALPLAPTATAEVVELHDALVFAIREYSQHHAFTSACIGLSGGIDSAVVAALAVRALGPSQVLGVTMPSHISSAETKADALLLAENLNIRCEVRPINAEYEAWEQEARRHSGAALQSLTKQNKQARIRVAILMEYANQNRGALVLSTGNKTELAVGYCTLYGDMCGGLAPLSDCSKARVYQLAHYINQSAGHPVIPTTIIERVPTAELEQGQTDAANLPADYDILSPLVDDIVDNELSRRELCELYDAAVVDQTLRLIHGSEFKRRQAAPGVRVTKKAFGVGRRYPLHHTFYE